MSETPSLPQAVLTAENIRSLWQTTDTGDADDDIMSFARAIESATLSRMGGESVPAGWKMVPEEAEPLMRSAIIRAVDAQENKWQWDAQTIWRDALAAAPTAPAQQAAPRGTDAQILKEREITANTISGAIAFGYLGNEAPPEDSAWLREFYDLGAKLKALEGQQAADVQGESADQLRIERDDWKRWCEQAEKTCAANGLAWAVSKWHDEVSRRPMVNVHRRSLDDTWRQVIRFFGGDPDKLVGPSHDAIYQANGNKL